MVLQDQEVRRRGREVHVHHRRHRPHWVVRGDHHVIRLGHRRDLLHFQQAAAHADVRLHDVQLLRGKDRAELVLGVITFAAGQRNVDSLRQLAHRVHVLRPDRLLQPQRVVRLDGPGQSPGPRNLKKLGMDIDGDIDVGPEGLANRSHALARDTAHLVMGRALPPDMCGDIFTAV